MSATIEGFAKSVGLFAAYFAIYESYVGFFQPNGVEQLENELGTYYEWFFRYNRLDAVLLPLLQDGMGLSVTTTTTSDQAKVVAVLQLLAALPVVIVPSRHRLYGLCLLSWFYMVAVRGHLSLQTPYVPVVGTMFGFTHVALLTHVLGGFFASTTTTTTATTTTTTDTEGDDAPTEEAKAPQTESSSSSSTKKGKNKKKTKTG